MGLLGLGTLVYVVASDSVAVMLLAALLRGASFGAANVAASVVVTSLAPRERSGEVVGYFGLAVGLAGLATPPAGLYLAEIVGLEWPFAIGGAAALVGSALGLAVSRRAAPTKQATTQLVQAIRDPRFAVPSLAFAGVSVAHGGIFTFGPLALPSTGWGSAASFLLAFGILRSLAAWLAGRQVDLVGARIVFYVGLAAGLVGLTALAVWPRTPLIEIAGGLYGVCFGSVQTATYASMLGRVARSDYGMVSAVWNSAFHLGTGGGAILVGIVVASQGLDAMFWALPVGLVVALFFPVPRREEREQRG
jgi:predicted MFS family arabinose efflux permease